MLVLSRKVNEEIVIGDNIRVRLVKIGGGRARLGISAPSEVSVRRAELPKKDGGREYEDREMQNCKYPVPTAG